MSSADLSRHFFVTGCASGIGRALASELAARGARVTATDRRLDALEDAASAGAWPAERVGTAALDVADAAAWASVWDGAEAARGPIDVLFNVAGVLTPGAFWDIAPDDVARHLDANVRGVILGTQEGARRMMPRKSGHIVNIASLAALTPVPGLALYSATKYAVRSYSLAASYELRPHGVAVTALCPDAVQTPMLDLQVGSEHAALTFSGPRALTTDDVVAALLGPVLTRRPLEHWLPTSRGLLARLSDLFPALGFALAPSFIRKGRAKQQALERSGP